MKQSDIPWDSFTGNTTLSEEHNNKSISKDIGTVSVDVIMNSDTTDIEEHTNRVEIISKQYGLSKPKRTFIRGDLKSDKDIG